MKRMVFQRQSISRSMSFLAVLVLTVSLSVSLRSETARVDEALDIAREWATRVEDNITERVLENGFKVYIYPMHETPEVLVKTVYRVGSRHERTQSTYGFAHLLEHMVFKGTTEDGLHLSETDICTIASKVGLGTIGCGFNAFTSFDSTQYHFNARKNNWQVFVRIMADWMTNLQIDPEHLNSEMKAVYQEIKLRRCDGSVYSPSELFPPGHVYATHRIIGFKENVLQADATELKEFYQEHYRPDNAALIVVGDVDEEEVMALANETFGAIPPSQSDSMNIAETPKPIKTDFTSKNITIYDEVPKLSVGLCWTIPGGLDEQQAMLANCTAGILSERLQRELHDEKQLVYSVGASAYPLSEDGIFSIGFMPKETETGTFESECTQAISEAIESMITTGPTSEEIRRYQRGGCIGVLRSTEYPGCIASWLADQFVVGCQPGGCQGALARHRRELSPSFE